MSERWREESPARLQQPRIGMEGTRTKERAQPKGKFAGPGLPRHRLRVAHSALLLSSIAEGCRRVGARVLSVARSRRTTLERTAPIGAGFFLICKKSGTGEKYLWERNPCLASQQVDRSNATSTCWDPGK